MNILLIGPAHPYRGGIAASNEAIAKTMQQQGHHVAMCTFKLQYPKLLFPGKSQFSTSPAPEGLKIYRGINSINPLNWRLQGRKIRSGVYDVVIVRYWTPFLAPALGAVCRAAKTPKTCVVALVDNLIPHEHHVWDRGLTKYFLKSADAFVTMSEQVKREIESFDLGKSVLTSPHPIYDVYGQKMDRRAAAERLGLDASQHWVLFFGLIRPYKGLDWLLEAWKLLCVKGVTQGKKLLVAGEFYGGEEAYRKQIAQLGLEDEVVIHNYFILDNDVKAYFSLADVVVQPYKSATQSGITQIAYHFELPMIVTNVGGLSEIVPDGKVGYVADPNPRAVAHAVERFYAEGPLDRFAQGIRQEKQRFSWEALSHILLTV